MKEPFDFVVFTSVFAELWEFFFICILTQSCFDETLFRFLQYHRNEMGKFLSFKKKIPLMLFQFLEPLQKEFVHISYDNFCLDQNVKFVCKVKIDRSKLSFGFDDFHIVSAILCYWSVIVVSQIQWV